MGRVRQPKPKGASKKPSKGANKKDEGKEQDEQSAASLNNKDHEGNEFPDPQDELFPDDADEETNTELKERNDPKSVDDPQESIADHFDSQVASVPTKEMSIFEARQSQERIASVPTNKDIAPEEEIQNLEALAAGTSLAVVETQDGLDKQVSTSQEGKADQLDSQVAPVPTEKTTTYRGGY